MKLIFFWRGRHICEAKDYGFYRPTKETTIQKFFTAKPPMTSENTIWGILNETNQWRVNPSDIASVLSS